MQIKLPNPNDPLVLADGTALLPSVHTAFASAIEVPSHTEAVKLVSSTRRKLIELPALPKQLNAYAAILVYTASGLSDGEISVATGFTSEQIQHLRTQAAYRQLEGMVIEAAKNEAANDVKAILVNGEKQAARKVVTLVDSVDEKVALAAAKDLLDRGGHKAAEKLDINARMANTVMIELVDKRDDGVTIEMEPL